MRDVTDRDLCSRNGGRPAYSFNIFTFLSFITGVSNLNLHVCQGCPSWQWPHFEGKKFRESHKVSKGRNLGGKKRLRMHE